LSLVGLSGLSIMLEGTMLNSYLRSVGVAFRFIYQGITIKLVTWLATMT
jgi:hypothetical protein